MTATKCFPEPYSTLAGSYKRKIVAACPGESWRPFSNVAMDTRIVIPCYACIEMSAFGLIFLVMLEHRIVIHHYSYHTNVWKKTVDRK